MRRCVLVLALVAFAVAACGRGPKPSSATGNGSVGMISEGIAASDGRGVFFRASVGAVSASGGAATFAPSNAAPALFLFANLSEAAKKDGFDAAVAEGLKRMAEGKWRDALTSFVTAQCYKSDEGVGTVAAKLEAQLIQEERAKRIAVYLQAILDSGKPAEAAELAAEAFLQFGHTDAADTIQKLARQGNAIAATEKAKKTELFAKCKAIYDRANRGKNPRAAAFALEQALLFGDDNGLKMELDRIRNTLTKFDALRTTAFEQRRDPAQIEGAIATLEEAAKIPDAPSVQSDLDDFRFALHYRRERVAVAQFDVLSDIGLPDAGAFVAARLATALRRKFDLVERGQVDDIVAGLKLKNGLTDDDLAQQKLGETAHARYLIVGTIAPIAGITVQAQLIDLRTRLIVQTARINAANGDDLATQISHLGQILMMTDDEKRHFEEGKVKDTPPVSVSELNFDANMALPPPPESPAENPPPPIIPIDPKPPDMPASLQPEHFANLPPPPGLGQPLPVVVLPADRELNFRRRCAFAALELGDNFFLRRRFREAFIQYEFCLNLFPEDPRVLVRIERCRPQFPPLPSGDSFPIRKPRIAALDFLTFGDPAVVPPYLGRWTAESLAPYFGSQFAFVDRSVLYWWMGRLGVTQADLLNDPVARQYVGRALGVRYFLFGNLIESTSFDVLCYLVDAEYGFLAGGAGIHVRGLPELKMRVSELATLIQATSDERSRFERDAALWDLKLADIRRPRQTAQNLSEAERLAQSAILCRRALEMRPNNVEMACVLDGIEVQLRQLKWDAARNQSVSDQQQFLQNRDQLQTSLEDAVDSAWRAERVAAADSRSLQQKREEAAQSLLSQARAASQGGHFLAAISCCESAADLGPTDAIFREMAIVRIKADEMAQADATAAVSRDAALRANRVAELAKARAELDRERQARAVLDLARSKIAMERDRTEAARLIAEAQRRSDGGQWPEAVSFAQSAQRLRATADGERLLNQWLIKLAKANADRKGAAARNELEQQLEADSKAERDAKANQRKFENLMEKADQAIQAQQFDTAIELFKTAKSIYATDIVLTRLNRANAARVQALAKIEADRGTAQDEQKKAVLQTRRLANAETALAAKQFEKAVALYNDAKANAPNDMAVLTGLIKSEFLREQSLAAAYRAREGASNKAAFDRFIESGKANLAANKCTAAAVDFGEAIRLDPNDANAKALLADAAGKTNAEEVQKKSGPYLECIRHGRRYLATKQFDLAQQKFREAFSLLPGDKAAEGFLNEAGRAKTADEVKLFLKVGYERMAAEKWNEAKLAFDRASLPDDKDPEIVKARAELRQAKERAKTVE